MLFKSRPSQIPGISTEEGFSTDKASSGSRFSTVIQGSVEMKEINFGSLKHDY